MERAQRKNPVMGSKGLPDSGKVTVACKLPHGLFLRIFNMEKFDELVMGGGVKERSRAVQVGEAVKINGNAVPFGQVPSYRIVGGYALTEGVDAQFFAKWWNDNQDADVVKNGLIFAYEKIDSAVDAAKDHKTIRSGLEPLAQKGDPRVGKNTNPHLGGIEPADRKE